MHPRDIAIEAFSYDLPDEKIARYPLAERDASRLLIFRDGQLAEDIYRNIGNWLPEKSLLVFNNTRVIEARLLFQKQSGGIIEIFCLEPGNAYPDISTAMLQTGSVEWKCIIGGASKWKHGLVLEKKIDYQGKVITLQAKYVSKEADHFIITLQWEPAGLPFAEILHAAGAIPLPPYLKRNAEASDTERYQTVFAQKNGSVAAPTAGLHFTPALLGSLREKNIRDAYLTLHVGAGTFKPVKSETMAGHSMHAEFFEVDAALLQQLLDFENNIIAVGTTSARTLESLYWMGVKLVVLPGLMPSELSLDQWEVYDRLQEHDIPFRTAIDALLHWLQSQQLEKIFGKTQLMIAPGYTFKVIRGLATNFHQPHSTLLLLVAAIAGDRWRELYDYALQHGFRFLSYGDGCLII